MKHALVTGSGGFIGRYMVRALLARRDFSRVDTADLNSVDPVDCRDLFSHDDAPPGYYDLVVHAAAYVGGRAAIDNHAAYIGAYNLQLDGALFEWALRARPRHLVYISSSAVYPVSLQGNGRPVGVKELLTETDVDLRHPRLPDQTYGWTKLTGERLAAEYAEADARSHVHVVRPFSGYGTDQGMDYPFGAFLNRTRLRVDPFRIWGSGQQVRDWVHVEDVIQAILAIADADCEEPINICTGIGTNMLDLAKMFVVLTGDDDYDPEFMTDRTAPSGVSHRVGDPSLLNMIYTPKIPLQRGVSFALGGSL